MAVELRDVTAIGACRLRLSSGTALISSMRHNAYLRAAHRGGGNAKITIIFANKWSDIDDMWSFGEHPRAALASAHL